MSDRSGKNPVHFGTRNCSIQSTGLQKRVEVAPGFVPAQMDYSFDAAKVLQDIVHYSLTMARKVGYDNVGTWEWIVTRQGEPFLMEVNTRIQVENGVSDVYKRQGPGRGARPHSPAPGSRSRAPSRPSRGRARGCRSC